MNTKNHSRRTVLKMLIAGSAVSMGTACEALNSVSFPRFGNSGSTDGSELALRVRQALRKHPYTSQLIVRVASLSDDVVVVKGAVDKQADIDNLNLVANQVEGVRHAQIDVYATGD